MSEQKTPVDVIAEHRFVGPLHGEMYTARCSCEWQQATHNTGTTTRRLHAQHLLEVLGLTREWGWRHPIDDEAEDWNEPGSWYSEDLHDGAKERASAAAAKSGAPVFSRYVSKWVAE